MSYYIRIGEISENEKSGIYRSGEKIGEEEGVSVYNAVVGDKQHWNIVLPYPLTEVVINDLQIFYTMLNCDVYETPPIYLVEGDVVGYGSSNEPLLRNVKIIQKLDRI